MNKLISILLVFQFSGCWNDVVQAQEFSNVQIVNAIYLAEGGINATYAYGIRSVHYSTKSEARRIAFRTVENNKKRFEKYGYRLYPSFIQFLGSRFCPTTGRDRSESEIRLNQYWVKNVMYYLNHPKVVKK